MLKLIEELETNIECYIGRSFAKSDVRGNSYIIFIWRYILA